MNRGQVDKFLETKKATCKHHGTHGEWRFIERKSKTAKGRKYTYRTVECRKCARERTKKYNSNNPDNQDNYRFSYDGCLVRVIAQARIRSKRKSLPFNIDVDWLKKALLKQENKCFYSGLEFDFSRPESEGKNRFYIPSIDQKIPGLGYSVENSVVVCSVVNMMKNELHLNDFINICHRIVANVQ